MSRALFDVVAMVSTGNSAIDDWKTGAELAQAVLTTTAIIIGGIWTYLRFIKNRLRFPRAELSHTVVYKNLSAGKSLLRISLKVVNQGDVLLPISKTWTRISQILPMTANTLNTLETGINLQRDDDAEIKWPEIDCLEITYEPKTAEIEPGELEYFHFDFIVPCDLKVVHVYSFFTNKKKKESGWPCTTIIDLNEMEGASNAV